MLKHVSDKMEIVSFHYSKWRKIKLFPDLIRQT